MWRVAMKFSKGWRNMVGPQVAIPGGFKSRKLRQKNASNTSQELWEGYFQRRSTQTLLGSERCQNKELWPHCGLKRSDVSLKKKKKKITGKVVQHWTRLSTKAVESPSLESFKILLDEVTRWATPADEDTDTASGRNVNQRIPEVSSRHPFYESIEAIFLQWIQWTSVEKLAMSILPFKLEFSCCEIRSLPLLMHINYVVSLGKERKASHKACFKDLEILPVNILEHKLPQQRCKLEIERTRK